MTPRALLLTLVMIGCGDAGRLHPFASGAMSGSGTDSASGGSGEGSSGGDDGLDGVIYVRCPRTPGLLEVTADVVVDGATVTATRSFHHADVYDRLPGTNNATAFLAPCDLQWQRDGAEPTTLWDCSSSATATAACVALDPAISHDGTRVAFVVLDGTIDRYGEQIEAQVLRDDAEPGPVGSIDLPNPRFSPTASRLVVMDLRSGQWWESPAPPGAIRRSPTFLADGRVAFASTLPDHPATQVREGAGDWTNLGGTARVGLLAQADADDVPVALGSHHLTAARTPLQLRDGRVAHVSTQRVGLLPFRYTNGSPGSPGGFYGVHHVYVQDPDGARMTALLGQHTHLQGGWYSHSSIASLGQLSDGRVLAVEGAGPPDAGKLLAFAPDPDGREGPAPFTVDAPLVFLPADLELLTPWAAGPGSFGAAMPPPAVSIDGYADPLAYAGRVRDTSGEPGGGVLMTWAKGGCSDVGSNELLPEPKPPATSGNGGLVPLHALERLGLDNPGCDAGIVRASTVPIAHPGALQTVVDTPQWHELMPVAVRPFAQTHGQDAPTIIEPAHRRAAPDDALPLATPFALLGASSLLQHETRSVEGAPFAGEIQWALQGAQSSEWLPDEVCGVRIAALVPNVAGDDTALRSAMGHRVRILAELPVRKSQDGAVAIDPLGDPDTSFRVRVPADTPLVIASLDCDGRVLTASQVPFSLRPGEDRRCGGCHVRSTLPLRFEDTLAATRPPLLAGDGTVQLLAGGTTDGPALEQREGWGLELEFSRDVWPILADRCASCHAGESAAAGLRLDLPGTDVGSTWWRLAADYAQAYVPPAQQVPVAGTLRKPQLSRYVRFGSARGSLLYWKAANARTDGRTDASFGDGDGAAADVDFGPEHPTEATAAELRTLARWIDTGAAAGAAVLLDAMPPVLVARIAAADPTTLAVGSVDIGDGIAPDSLELAWRDDDAWIPLASPPAATAGVIAISLAGVPDDATLRIAVSDAAGNTTTIEHPRAALLEP
ncbi:MAG: hypothetical protein U0168_09145 [Nannocystaceae bacterium]